jgi:hypothetical protein
MDASIRSGAQSKDIDQLAALARKEHLAVGAALGDALHHAMAAGDALLAMRELVPPGHWEAHVRRLEISERSARVYQRVAKNRSALDRQSSAGPLSIAAALEFLKDPKDPARKRPAAKAKPSTSFDALAWWQFAPRKEREHFLSSVGLKPILEAVPASWRDEFKRRAATPSENPKITKTLKVALSLAKTDPNSLEIISALGAVRNLLSAQGFDPDRIERVIIEAGKVDEPANRAA